MGLNYNRNDTVAIIGTKSGTTRSSWALTSSYQTEASTQPTKSFKVGGYSKINLDVLYTTGATETNNSLEVRIEGSPDGTNFYRVPNVADSSGVSTLYQREFTFVGASAATAYDISIGLDIFYEYMRFACKESGVVTNAGTVYIEATLSGN